MLTTNNNIGGFGSGGSLNFVMGQGSIQFTGTGGALTINSQSYTLIQNMTELASTGSTGYYALAESLNASGVAGFTPIGQSTAFTGTFKGLGNTVSNLVISSTSYDEAGLFGQVGSSGVVENIGLVGGSVTDVSHDELSRMTCGNYLPQCGKLFHTCENDFTPQRSRR